MPRLFAGIALTLIGVCMFVFGMYYGWISSVPGAGPATYSRYQILSDVFGILTLVFILGGALTVFFAIRRMNLDYAKEKKP